MKKSIISSFIILIVITTACKKNETNSTFNVDVKKYDTQLNLDYTQANIYHTALLPKAPGSNPIDTPYYEMMYNRNDSFFCEHFYQFCIDMMKNSGMMSGSNGMMGNNSGMMGNGGMMNGGTMGNMQDMNKMMSFMDSLHYATKNGQKPDFEFNDSLMHNQMTMCKMMTSQTTSIENVYNNMQTLRTNHKLMH